MSNHSGSYMLNQVIEILDRHEMFSGIETTTAQTAIKEIIEMATNKYDCNRGEILEGYAQQFNLCSYCLADNDNPEDELCPTCREDWDRTD
jgi:hypothetical protein